ncbi:MAG TPA: hypothetical protein VNT30_17755 [Stellaceae bacterium]|nr:hypothetical protein [Stellaceae bacterium]
MATFKPNEFFASYKAEKPAPVPYSLDGLIKPGPGGEIIGFSFASCQEWIDLPTSLIETIEPITTVTCDDHEHPFVMLTFAQAKTPEIAALLALIEGREKSMRKSIKNQRALQTVTADVNECLACLNNCSDTRGPGQPRLNCYKTCCN